MQIGEQLKEAREQKNLTLDDIQATTKIQKRYLVAIEQNDLHALPGRFYARAFIKEYATAVGLDSDLLLASFDEGEISTNEEKETVKYSRLKRTRKSKAVKDTSIFSYLPSVIVVLLIISILIVAWTLYQKSLDKPTGDSIENQDSDEIIQHPPRNPGETTPNPDEKDENEQEENDNQNEREETEEDLDELFEIIDTGTGSSPESTIKFTNNSEGLNIVLEASEDSYVQVKGESGRTYVDTLLTANMSEQLDLSEEQRIYFNVGHAPGMKILINDELLEFPVNANESVHQKIWLEIN